MGKSKNIGIAPSIALACMVCFQSLAALPDPVSAEFAHGVEFTVSGYAAERPALSGFPVLVRISQGSPSGFYYSDIEQASASDLNSIDIAFADMAGNWLPFEIDTWNTSGESLVWVLLPSMSNGTKFLMYWGGETAGKSLNANNPWSDYTGVWHMGETGTSSSSNPVTIHDSTANGLDGFTPVGESASGSMVGGAWRIAKDNNHDRAIRVPATSGLAKTAADALGTDFHASFWFRAKGDVPWSYLISRRKGEQGTGWGFLFHSGTPPALMRVHAGSKTYKNTSDTYNLGATLCEVDDVWKKVDVVWRYASNNNVQIADIYLNGAYLETVPCNEAVKQENTDIGIGCSTQDSYSDSGAGKGRRVNGEMDEVRLGAFVPSADWIAADYATQSSPSFLTAGAAESIVETSDPQFAVSVPQADISYVGATISVAVLGIGTGASEAEVEVVVSASSDYANPVWTANYTVTAANTRDLAVTGLSYGTTYYVKATVTCDAADANPVVKTASFTTPTPGVPSGAAAFVERGFTTLSASVSVSDFGTGAESATVWLEASQTDDFASVVASDEVSAALDGTSAIVVRGLSPGTAYNLRAAIRNNWGLVTYVALPAAATRAVPFATTGIGWTFSQDGSTIDISFGVSGIYDGATGSASLTYNGQTCGSKPVSAADTLTWPGVAAANGTATATVVLSATLGGQTYSQTFTATIAPGSTAVAVSDIADHASAATAIRVKPRAVVTLPELSGTARYILGNNLFATLDGNVLTATRPGILGVHCVGLDGATNTLAVLVLPEKIGDGDIYVFKDESIGNGWGYWNDPSKWERIGSETNDSWPHNPDDIAIVAYYQNTGVQFDARDCDITLGEFYAGGYRDDKAAVNLRCATGSLKSKYSFQRTDGKPARIQLCSNSTYLGNNAFRTSLLVANSVPELEFRSDTILSGGWDGSAPTYPQGRFELNAKTNAIPAGVTVELVEMDTQAQSMGCTLSVTRLAGSGTFWNHSSATMRVYGSPLFSGLLRDSGGHGAGTHDRTAPTFVRTDTLTNVAAEVVGWVGRSGSDPNDNFTAGVGALVSGWPHFFGATGPHDPWFPRKGTTMHGGLLFNRSENASNWIALAKTNFVENADNTITTNVTVLATLPDKRLTDFLDVARGFVYLRTVCTSVVYPTTWFEAADLRHGDKATLYVNDSRVYGSGGATNTATILHGVSAHAVGKAGDPATGSAYPIVPWIATQAGSKADEDMRFATFDGNGLLVGIAHATDKKKALSAYGEDDNAYVWRGDVSLSADTTLNSLSIVNDATSKQLGESRTLALTSGGLILGDVSWLAGASGIGEESGGAANGSLVLGDATHPAYVWARGAADTPNQIWTPVTAPGGFVAAYTGNLVLGGDQTGIGDEIAVNAGTLALGTAESRCALEKRLPIRIFANATLKVPNAGSTGSARLRFDGAAGWFGKVEIPEGVAARCLTAEWRDYPESPEWRYLEPGTYSGDEAVAAACGGTYAPQYFTGSGTMEVLKDGRARKVLYILR